MHVHRVLCPIDFSEPSTHALEQATRLARWYGARLAVLHVRPTVTPHPDMPEKGPVALWLTAELDGLRQRIAAVSHEATAAGVEVETIATAEEPVRGILACARTLPADLIVLGTHGTSGFQHLILGSVTEKVLRKAPCPVLTVPPRVQSSTTQFTRLICAVDFSDCSLKAATFAASLAKESGAYLTLLHVVEWPWHESALPEMAGVTPVQAQAIADTRRCLETGAKGRLDAMATSVMPTGTVATSPLRQAVCRGARCRASGTGRPDRARGARPGHAGSRLLRLDRQSLRA